MNNVEQLKMEKIKNFGICVVIILFLILSFFGGIQYEISRGEKEDYVTQNLIAVVNADEGIWIEQQKVNYAADFMNFPDVNFISTSLTDAREGVKNGRYAAYIIIPSDFSQAVNSINTAPIQADILYEIGDQLRADVREEVIQDIQDFIMGLNSNVSYVYVNAIMDEFHSAQNGAEVVLNNDINDLEQINAIQAEDLIYAFTYPEWKRVEWEMEDADYALYYKRMDEAVQEIESDYENGMEEGRWALEQLAADKIEVESGIRALNNIIESFDPEYVYLSEEVQDNPSLSQNAVYEEGLIHLKEYTESDSEELGQQTTVIMEMIKGKGEGQLNTSQGVKNPNINMGEVSIALKNNQKQVESALEDVWDSQISVSFNSITDKNFSGNEDDYIVIRKEALEVLASEIGDFGDTRSLLDDARRNLYFAIEDLPIKVDKRIQEVIDTEIVEPLMENIEAETQRLKTSQQATQELLDDFFKRLQEYNLLEYVDEGEIEDQLLSMQENIGEMEKQVEEKNLEYLEFVMEIYDISDENYGEMLQEVELANTQTMDNIVSAVAVVKEGRLESNEINSSFLQSFSQKLPYTRIGHQENLAVNQFIVSPITTSQVDTGLDVAKNKSREGNILPAVLPVGVIIFILLISNFIYLYKTKERKEEET